MYFHLVLVLVLVLLRSEISLVVLTGLGFTILS